MHLQSNIAKDSRYKARGSVLMIALLLVLLGTFGITAWFGLIAARSLEVEAKESAMERRVQLNGVRELARQIASQGYLADDDGNTLNTQVTLPDGAGSVDIAPWSGAAYTHTSQSRYDQVGGVPLESYTTDLVATLDDGGGTLGALTYGVQVRSYVPALAGDLLVLHESGKFNHKVKTDSNLLVNGRTMVWDPTQAVFHRTSRLHCSGRASTLSLLDLAGNPVLPDNEAFAPRSTGNGFVGKLKSVVDSESTANRYLTRLAGLSYVSVNHAAPQGDLVLNGYEADGTGKVAVDLGNPSVPHLLLEGDTDRVVLVGQMDAAQFTAAGSLPPLLIIVTDAPGGRLTGVSALFQGENNRPLVFAMRNDIAPQRVTVSFEPPATQPFPRWRGIFELENTPITINSSGAGVVSEVHIRGGIRTDDDIATSSFPVRVLEDTATPNAEAIASRVGFVEIFRN